MWWYLFLATLIYRSFSTIYGFDACQVVISGLPYCHKCKKGHLVIFAGMSELLQFALWYFASFSLRRELKVFSNKKTNLGELWPMGCLDGGRVRLVPSRRKSQIVRSIVSSITTSMTRLSIARSKDRPDFLIMGPMGWFFHVTLVGIFWDMLNHINCRICPSIAQWLKDDILYACRT